MAMIQCPECGQEISDKATTCPHCGTPIFVCPECGHISVGNIPFCENCGFTTDTKVLSAQPHDVKKQDSHAEITASNDIVELWLKNNPNEVKMGKAIRFVNLFCDNIAKFVLVIIWAFVVFMPWTNIQNKDPNTVAELILNYQTYYRSTWIIASVMIVLTVIACLVKIYAAMWDKRCIQWIKDKKIDIKSALKKETSDLFTSGTRKYDNSYVIATNEIKCMYYTALKSTNLPDVVECIGKILGFIASVILICNVANLGNAMIAKAVIGKEMIESIWWIVKGIFSPALIVSYAILLIYMLVISSLILSGKKIDTYLKQIISE